MTDQSLFAGAALRRLRKREGMTQAVMAERIGISPSYLNLIERNQRPVSARVIMQLVDVFDFDPRRLREDESIGGIDGLFRRLNDEQFADLGIDRDEANELLASAPQAAAAFARLFDAKSNTVEARYDPLVASRREIERWRNHFADLDAAAEELADEMRLSRADFGAAMTERLREKHQLAIRILPREVMPDANRRLDFHARQVQLAETLPPASRNFQMALQIAELEQGDAISALAAGSSFEEETARRFFERHLTGYFAAAMMMPYGRFLRACDATGYDLRVLVRRFGASIEQVAHRLTTLQRVGQRGLPFFMARVDRAGQFSKRFAGASGTTLLESEYGCPLWKAHQAFDQPDRWHVQAVDLEEMAGGPSHWLTMSHAISSLEGSEAGQFSIVLGLEARLAKDLAQARSVSLEENAATMIGLGCARCHRLDCLQRSLPPRGTSLRFDRVSRAKTPFSFGN
ncbi:helix-turn-helix domain-containing protein [Parerythrobacter jejuensis]|uniref:Helix-turn-helix domain-containing protein n=1 Tax=Parerythrobacter jejuensis TaxID=795812 RepID=A0A845ARJ2_9SPHN|nr:helix-turn-helix transcriptional regulator [Parerythrobacter jejuensis]MXP32214.1 helix-turn-helix domain-containing protein [Parerythrobacter jejuensis]